jgi:hypothetical protein
VVVAARVVAEVEAGEVDAETEAEALEAISLCWKRKASYSSKPLLIGSTRRPTNG